MELFVTLSVPIFAVVMFAVVIFAVILFNVLPVSVVNIPNEPLTVLPVMFV